VDRVRRTPAVLGAVVLAMALLAACGGSSSSSSAGSEPSGPPKDGGAMTIAVGGETNGWNPHQDEWAQSGSLVGSSVLEPLATTGPNLKVEPWLATSWTPNATYDSWTIVLRQGVTFQDGEAFDATAVKKNIDDAVTGPISGQAVKGLIKDTVVIDAHTVRVDMSQPWAAFPSSWLNGQSAMMMAPKMLDQPKGGQTHPIGTGPFTFVSWQPGSAFVTRKNPTYWQKGLPHLDSLTFKVITDPSTQASALQTGDVKMVFATSAIEANQLQGGYTQLRDWSSEPGMVVLNTLPKVNGKDNALANLHARRALAYATDQTTLAAAFGKGVQTPSSPFPPSSPWGMPASENGYPGFDLQKAKDEVKAYEQDTGASSLSFTLLGGADATMQRLLQLLQSQWSAAGIHANIQTGQQASQIEQVVFGNYQAAIFNIYSSPDPDQNYYFWSSSTSHPQGALSLNFAHYSTAKIDANLKVGRENPDTSARKAAYDDIVKEINGAATDIWTYSTAYSLIASHDVHGLDQSKIEPFGNFQPKTWLADLWLG
jgi:peptide/nickel transport system substrate-binding protein